MQFTGWGISLVLVDIALVIVAHLGKQWREETSEEGEKAQSTQKEKEVPEESASKQVTRRESEQK